MRNLYEQCLKLTQFAAMEFEEIFQFSQERLKQALETELIENGYAVRKQRGFLYAEGTVPVLLVAHLDTVHRTQPETICYSADGTVMMSPQGIGGDRPGRRVYDPAPDSECPLSCPLLRGRGNRRSRRTRFCKVRN